MNENIKAALMKKVVICIDRDGTLINDEKSHLFLGSDNGWKSKVKILPGVIDGLERLGEIPGSAIYMITNQPGVAISDYPLLTLERAEEVCSYVIDRINEKVGVIDGYFLCPFATQEYVNRKPDFNFDENFVQDNSCLKPALGMVLDVLASENVTEESASIYVIGDRATDVQTALNINGFGILIPFENEPGEKDKVEKLEAQKQIYIASDLLDAAEFIIKREKSLAQ